MRSSDCDNNDNNDDNDCDYGGGNGVMMMMLVVKLMMVVMRVIVWMVITDGDWLCSFQYVIFFFLTSSQQSWVENIVSLIWDKRKVRLRKVNKNVLFLRDRATDKTEVSTL